MEFLDARRLTGPSLLFDEPGSILDVACDAAEAKRLPGLWEAQVRRILAELDWPDEPEFASLRLRGGISLGYTAPIDALYAAAEVSEWAWAACAAEFGQADAPDFAATLATLKKSLADECNPELIALQSAAAERGVTFLWDDDQVSLGLGKCSGIWPVRKLPAPATLDWQGFADIPVGLVTGTNGKTTCVRLAAHILEAAGLRAGFSSTDYIAVGQEIVDRDDWSGPGGARSVLRHTDVGAAVLETARGGLLRRGLGLERADAALITNIGRDHLGDFGSRSLDELLAVKWIVSRAVADGGTLVLNADDERLVGNARGYAGRLVWFSLDADNTIVNRHTADGGAAFILDGDRLALIAGSSREVLLAERDIPIAVRGAARHNVANALAAAALTWGMGAEMPAIRDGLRTMSQADNPGRGNLYTVDDVTVLVDFAHNPQAMRALLDMATRLPAKRRVLCCGQAGDRPDELIRELARNAWESGLDRVYVSELARYRRGRAEGEVFALIRDELLRCGANASQIEYHDEEIESLEAALAWAEPGDLVIMLALERSQPVYDKLRSIAAH